MENKFIVPKEIVDLFREYDDIKECQEIAVKNAWSYKRALKYAKMARKLKDKGWSMIRDLYPELEGKSATLDYDTREVTPM